MFPSAYSALITLLLVAAAQVATSSSQTPVSAPAPSSGKRDAAEAAAAKRASVAPASSLAAKDGAKDGIDERGGGLCAVVSGGCAAAISANERLKRDLEWVFGGRTQRGWQLYEPLIAALLGASGDDTRSLVSALGRWQLRAGLPQTGILDRDTWAQMVAYLQSRRIRTRSYPSANELTTVEEEYLYDPERPVELRGVEREAYAAYKRMYRAAAAELGLQPGEKWLKIISAFRSREYQAALRRQSPNSGRAGLAVNSPHFTGRALDLYVGGEPVSTRDANRALQTSTPVYRWLVRNAERFGFRPYFYEPWHWEYIPQQAQ